MEISTSLLKSSTMQIKGNCYVECIEVANFQVTTLTCLDFMHLENEVQLTTTFVVGKMVKVYKT